MISRACYVSCDDCGLPAGVVVPLARRTPAAEARLQAASEGFTRRAWPNGGMLDLCGPCTKRREAARA